MKTSLHKTSSIIYSLTLVASFVVSGCGRDLTNSIDPSLVPLQRGTHVDRSLPPQSQGLTEDVTRDWNNLASANTPVKDSSGTVAKAAPSASPMPTPKWATEIKKAGDRASGVDPDKIVPDRSYRSIWVHIFPFFAMDKAYAAWPKRMPAPDPYTAAKDLSSIRFESETGFKVASLKDGSLIHFGQSLSFNLSKRQFILDGTAYPFQELYVDASSFDITDIRWDHMQTPYKYRGSFVITREEGPTGQPTLRVVNVVDFEAYLMDVVPAEMPGDYPTEALKVQAVAARTYALNKMLAARCDYSPRTQQCGRSVAAQFDVSANTQDQLYMGVAKEMSRSNLAVSSTAGEVVVHNGQVAFAMFHANSGGQTCSYSDCFGGLGVPYLESKVEPDKEGLRKLEGGTNNTTIDPMKFASALRSYGVEFPDDKVENIAVTGRNESARAQQLTVKGATSTAVVSQKVLQKLREEFRIATNYLADDFKAENGKITVTSYGWGHGVGISQDGARLQAQRGVSYRDIVEFYYSKCNVMDLRKVAPGSI